MNTINDGTRRARKPHRCDECHRIITLGQQYYYQTNVDGSDIWTHRSCIECRRHVALQWDLLDHDADNYMPLRELVLEYEHDGVWPAEVVEGIRTRWGTI